MTGGGKRASQSARKTQCTPTTCRRACSCRICVSTAQRASCENHIDPFRRKRLGKAAQTALWRRQISSSFHFGVYVDVMHTHMRKRSGVLDAEVDEHFRPQHTQCKCSLSLVGLDAGSNAARCSACAVLRFG